MAFPRPRPSMFPYSVVPYLCTLCLGCMMMGLHFLPRPDWEDCADIYCVIDQGFAGLGVLLVFQIAPVIGGVLACGSCFAYVANRLRWM